MYIWVCGCKCSLFLLLPFPCFLFLPVPFVVVYENDVSSFICSPPSLTSLSQKYHGIKKYFSLSSSSSSSASSFSFPRFHLDCIRLAGRPFHLQRGCRGLMRHFFNCGCAKGDIATLRQSQVSCPTHKESLKHRTQEPQPPRVVDRGRSHLCFGQRKAPLTFTDNQEGRVLCNDRPEAQCGQVQGQVQGREPRHARCGKHRHFRLGDARTIVSQRSQDAGNRGKDGRDTRTMNAQEAIGVLRSRQGPATVPL